MYEKKVWNMIDIPTNWTFNDVKVACNFDDHVREQLPWYDMVSSAIAQIANHYIPEQGTVYDVGASTGNVERTLKSILIERNVDFIPIEKSQQMADMYTGDNPVIVADATEHSFEEFDFGVMFLTMMFIPPHRRNLLLDRMMDSLRDDGALVIVEKTIPTGGYVSTVLSRLTLRAKMQSGAKPDDIIKKELSLSGVQRPINQETLFSSYKYTEFFRYGEFGGYIIERNEA